MRPYQRIVIRQINNQEIRPFLLMKVNESDYLEKSNNEKYIDKIRFEDKDAEKYYQFLKSLG